MFEYRLFRTKKPIKNPKADRRVRHDWRATPVIPAQAWILIETHLGPSILPTTTTTQWQHVDQHDPIFQLITSAWEPATESELSYEETVAAIRHVYSFSPDTLRRTT